MTGRTKRDSLSYGVNSQRAVNSASCGSESCLPSLHPYQQFQRDLSGSGDGLTLCSCHCCKCLVPVGGSQWPVAGQVKCITSASLKFGSGIGTQLGPGSPRGTGSMLHPSCGEHRLGCCAGYKTVGPRWFQLDDFTEPGARALKLCSDFGSDLLVCVGDGLQSSESHWWMKCFGLLCLLISSKAVVGCDFNLEVFYCLV